MKSRIAGPVFWAVSLVTIVQLIILVRVMIHGSQDALLNVLLIFGVVFSAAAVLAIAYSRRNVARIAALRARYPSAVIFGAQTGAMLDFQLAERIPSPAGKKTTFGQLVTVVADSTGISCWKGPASRPEARALIPWSAIDSVEVGDVVAPRVWWRLLTSRKDEEHAEVEEVSA